MNYIKKGKVVGKIDGDSYITKRNPEKHLMRIYDAWGISESIIVDLARKGIRQVKVITSNKHYYVTTIAKLQEYSIKKVWSGDMQWFLPMKHWEEKTIGIEQESLFNV